MAETGNNPLSVTPTLARAHQEVVKCEYAAIKSVTIE
jgi:hypothetical protein